MALNAPFMFDTDFSAKPKKKEEIPQEELIPRIAVSEHEAILEAAEKAAFERGRKAGLESVEARAAEDMTRGSKRLVEAAEKLLRGSEEERGALEAEALSLALTTARKLASSLIETRPLAEIEALLKECLEPLRRTSHLVVRLAEDQAAPLDEILKKLALEKGFEGRLVVLGEPDFTAGDCRIEWADGGIIRNRAATEARIEELINTYLQARHGQSLPEAANNTNGE